MKDSNGAEIKTGDIVKVSNAFFKIYNGTYIVNHSPCDKNWIGKNHCMAKLNKSGTINENNYQLLFYPFIYFTNNNAKAEAARLHDRTNAVVEIIREAV